MAWKSQKIHIANAIIEPPVDVNAAHRDKEIAVTGFQPSVLRIVMHIGYHRAQLPAAYQPCLVEVLLKESVGLE